MVFIIKVHAARERDKQTERARERQRVTERDRERNREANMRVGLKNEK